MKHLTILIRFGATLPWIFFIGIVAISAFADFDFFGLPEEIREFDRLQEDRLGKANDAYVWIATATSLLGSILLWFKRVEGVWVYAVFSLFDYFYKIFVDQITIHTPILYIFSDIFNICNSVSASLVWVIHRYGAALMTFDQTDK